jgi:KDO2-lipid IV(A) lauroyltransferase
VAQYYLIPKSLAERFPRLASAIQSVETSVLQAVFWLFGRLRPEQASHLAAMLFGWVGPFTDKARKARVNLEIAFPDRDDRWRKQMIREIFRSLGRAAAELITLERIWKERGERLRFSYSARAREHIERRDPCIFVCAHVGAWQLTNLIAREEGLTITTVFAPESNPATGEMLGRLRESFGVKLVPSDAGVRPLIKELQAGNSLGLAMDTRLASGQLVPFFGRDALTNTSAARLALRTGAILLPIRCERTGAGSFHIQVDDPLVADDPEAAADEQALDLTRQINLRFEQWIRETPGEWICLKRRWPKAHRL